ncbi:MAG: sulfite exporter TauE/SafE family protein, partial [Thermodesulfobacteriota bacterium]
MFIASLAGSSHCAVMCGPIAVTVHSRIGYLPLYHLGRLASYLSLGVLAGLLGEKFLSQNYPIVSRVSLIMLSLFLIY